MTVFASLALGCALPPLAALATLSNLPAASTYLHLSQGLLGAIAGAVLLLSAALCIGIYRRRLPEQPYPDNLLVKVGRRTLRLPGRRLTLLQLVITALDVAAAATVLYLLLPEAPPFGPFLLVYLLALAAGVLSHVPGGVGVFEAILLAAFARQARCRTTGRCPAAVSDDLRSVAAPDRVRVPADQRGATTIPDPAEPARGLRSGGASAGRTGFFVRRGPAVFRRHARDRLTPGKHRLPDSPPPD